MAFISKSQRILPGGLNFSGPGDKIPPSDAIASQNLRVDNTGELRTRLTDAATISQFIGAGGTYTQFVTPITSLWLYEQANPRRYVGDHQAVYRVVAGANANSTPTVTKLAPTDGLRLGFANYQGYTWILNRSVQGKDNGTAAPLSSWVPLAPTTPVTVVAVAGSPGITGAYSYWVTFFTADGFESNLGPPANITDTAQANNLSAIPISADPTVVGRRIYRSGGGQDQIYQAAEIDDNVTTVLAGEQISDLAITDEGITHTLDHDPPPAAAGMAASAYYESLVGFSTAANVNRLFWTKTLQPGYWPGAALVTGNHVDVGDDGEAILRVTVKKNLLIIYKERTVWRLRGDFDSGILEQLDTGVGLVGVGALCSRGGLDYFQGPEAIFSCNGDVVTDISTGKMGALFKGDPFNYAPATQDPHYAINITPAARSLMQMGQRNGRIYMTYADSQVNYLNSTLVYCILTDAWGSDDRIFSCYYDEGPGYAFAGCLGPYVVNVEAAQVYPNGLNVIYSTHFDDQGAPRFAKLYGDLEIEVDFSVPTDKLTVTAYYNHGDYDSTSEVLGVIAAGAGRCQTVQFSQVDPKVKGSGSHQKNVSIAITGKVFGLVSIFAFHLKYQAEQRDALTFDTNAVQLFTGSFGQVTEFEVGLYAAGVVTWQFYSDISGDMELQANGTIQPGGFANRRAFQVPLGSIVEGRFFRLLLTAVLPMQIFGLRFSGRRLGVYIAPGGLFTTREMDFGSKRVKLFRKLEWNAEVDGQLSVAVKTDLPAGWAQRYAAAFTTAGVRAWFEQLFASNTRGRLFRIDATATGGATRLYGARVWMKTEGEAAASGWDWADIPLEPSEEIFAWIALPVDEPTTTQSGWQLPAGG